MTAASTIEPAEPVNTFWLNELSFRLAIVAHELTRRPTGLTIRFDDAMRESLDNLETIIVKLEAHAGSRL